MKKQHLFLSTVMLMLAVLSVHGQDPALDLHAEKNIPFGQKLPPPDLTNYPDKFLPQMIPPGNSTFMQDKGIHNANEIKKNPEYFRQLLLERRKTETALFENATTGTKRENEDDSASDFHLVKDINTLSESNPRNLTSHPYNIINGRGNDSASYAVLNNVIYFAADDGIHGSELWRSDGTDTGTYMVKDIQPGPASALLSNISALKGKIYFAAYTSGYGDEPWVSDGTANGTQLLMDISPDGGSSQPTEFFEGKEVYFIVHGFRFWSAIWQTDGTTAGTKQVIDIGARGTGGERITQPTFANGILFFTFINYANFAWDLWRSDGTNSGTYHIGNFSWNFYNIPTQLTNYNNKLYFSADDGTGRKLWVSDGTEAGTIPAPGNHNVLIEADKPGIHFPIRNNVLYLPGKEETKGYGLYKYDASNAAGLVKIKHFAPAGDTAFIVPSEMQLVNNTIYFKVVNYRGGIHDELWMSKGAQTSTHLVQKFLPGETMSHIYNGSGICYFVKYDKFFGNELWRAVETPFGAFPVPVSDIFKGPIGSSPASLTAFKGKLVFGANDEKKGYELFISDGRPGSAKLVKDINTVATLSSNAGLNYYNFLGYSGMVTLGNSVLFTAYEKVHGYELYKSDGTAAGTELLNDIIPGEAGVEVTQFISKNNTVYFIALAGGKFSIYKTNGTKNSLRKITDDFSYIQSLAVADNGLIFYAAYNNNLPFKLWRTDGTANGTVLLSSTVYGLNYLNVIGNTAFFVAGDSVSGNELWKSDGSVAGTKLIKDIYPGAGSSTPGGMYPYKGAVYFSAYDSTSSFPSFWKSNGTAGGTIKLKEVEPHWGNTATSTAGLFCVSNNILYFSAVNHSNTEGTKLWRTDGTPAGTRPVKDINPTNGFALLSPYLLTDVNGTFYFTADDGVHGRELWKSDGHYKGTLLVKVITAGNDGSNISGLTAFAGKLYFRKAVNGRYSLWTSDGTPEGTHTVDDPGIVNVGIETIFAAGNKLFLSGNTSSYGTELYVGKAEDQPGKFAMSRPANKKITLPFNAVLYPNPALSNATLQLAGDTKNAAISISDAHGIKLWQSKSINSTSVNLPMEKFAAGTYFITVTGDTGSKTIKLVKR